MSAWESTIQRARRSGNPVIDGDRATFIWEGDSVPYLISDLSRWEERPRPFKRVPARLKSGSAQPVWSYSLTLPRATWSFADSG